MLVKELFSRLATGPLSNTAATDDTIETVTEPYYGKIINYTNTGLMKLFSRFVQNEKTILIEQKAHITTYHLDSKYSLLKNIAPHPYIIDFEADPFEDDAIKIIKVSDYLGKHMTLNDPSDPYSLFTPKPLVLQVPNPIHGVALSVVYQARHPEIKYCSSEPQVLLDTVIDIPFFMEEPLMNYIASEYYSHMNGEGNSGKGQEYFAKYEGECAEIESKDLVNETYATTLVKFNERGFV